MVPETETLDRVAALSAVPLLAALSATQLEKVAESSREGAFPAGEAIIREGEMGSRLYLLLAGTAEVRRGGRRVGFLQPGQFFGEAALLVDQPRTADVWATTDVRCLLLERWDFWVAVGIDPRVNRALFDQTVQRLRSFRSDLVE